MSLCTSVCPLAMTRQPTEFFFSLLDSLTKNLRQFKFWLKSDKKGHFLLQALWVTRWLEERSYLLPTGNNGAHAAQLLTRFAFRMIQYWWWLFWVLASCVSERYCRRFRWTSTWSPCEGHFVNNSETWVVRVRWPEAWPSPTFVEIITNISAIYIPSGLHKNKSALLLNEATVHVCKYE